MIKLSVLKTTIEVDCNKPKVHNIKFNDNKNKFK